MHVILNAQAQKCTLMYKHKLALQSWLNLFRFWEQQKLNVLFNKMEKNTYLINFNVYQHETRAESSQIIHTLNIINIHFLVTKPQTPQNCLKYIGNCIPTNHSAQHNKMHRRLLYVDTVYFWSTSLQKDFHILILNFNAKILTFTGKVKFTNDINFRLGLSFYW